MSCKSIIAATAFVVASCCFSGASAAPAKRVRSAPARAVVLQDNVLSAYFRNDVPTLTAMAEAGNAAAQHNLGVMYDNGTGVAQDYAAAVSWYRKAADQGYAQAQYNLGVMHYNGQGVSQDYAAAAGWFRKAADQGYAKAQYNLGLMYAKGQGVPQDYVQAHKWLNLGATSGDADAVKSRDLVASMMAPAQIAEAQRLASAWRKR